jgi:peptidoglycan/LPS O-acetylase OafA/YrhL
VVFIHYVGKIDGHPPLILRSIGRLVENTGDIPVALFFVLSGFILTYNHVKPDTTMRVSRSKFWLARFARIYPVYLLGFLLFAPFAVVKALGGHVSLFLSIAVFSEVAAASLLLLQAWTPYAVFWNAPSWSLSVEAFFYALFPLLAPRAFRQAWIKNFWLTALLWTAAFAALLVHVTAGPDAPWWIKSANYNPALWLSTFAIGILTAQLFMQRNAGESRTRMEWLIVLTPVFGLFLWRCPPSFRSLLGLALAPFFGWLIYTLGMQGGLIHRFLSMPLLRLFGQASYSLYLIHVPLWNYLIPVSNRLFFHSRPFTPQAANFAGHWTIFFVYVIFSVVLSILCFLWVEEPLRRRISNATFFRPNAHRRFSGALTDLETIVQAGEPVSRPA